MPEAEKTEFLTAAQPDGDAIQKSPSRARR
jgi:hypothetical protein